ncbi:hypothetical protein LTR78_002343 [Recurvomyces mirabilis]|uniref:Uncharacterized protein n=1 Tax=Recurvomyces mirabilis TaxID=574656 RepID=A0AAE0WTG7_9PEZI|nr:hypothetical protein LTR78_002343 [Recurvomyces mirabilis]KAK5157272.1 hypothetical protein LTS14_004037 [Recurvomyces mirabilis]
MHLPPDMFAWDQSGLRSLVTLYVTRPEFKSKLRDGIVYNQDTHLCLFYESEFDLPGDAQYGKPLPWQPLETVLSVYIDMIERRKVVALHKSVCEPPMQFAVPQPDGSIKMVGMPAPEGIVQEDPVTGLRRVGEVFNPWKMQSYTKRDVDETLTAWNMLAENIELKMDLAVLSTLERGLYTADVLRQVGLNEDRFAWKFFTEARKPRCTYLGPGLRLPAVEEFLQQPFQSFVDNDYPLNPIQILTSEQRARNQWHGWTDVPTLPAGLYLDACNASGLFPFEDGCRLILPYNLGGIGYATTSDGRPIQRNCDLYHLGHVNPFMPAHPTPLLAVLGHFRGYVETGMWNVGSEGVKEGIERFLEADTDMARWRDDEERIYPGYVCGFGAGERWW